MQHDFILLDRSGSMESLWVEALSSVNAYVEKLAQDNVDTGVTLVVFDGGNGLRFDVIRDRITPSTWRPVTSVDATPRGMTPLNDATAKIVSMAEAGTYDKVAIIIMTDGHENDSKEFPGAGGTAQVKAMLDRCRAKNWAIVYLGANFDNAAQATSYGAARGMHVNSTANNLRSSMSTMANKRAAYGVSGQAAAMSWTDEEKEKAKK